MEEKRNYAIYVDSDNGYGDDDIERIVKMTEIQAKAIEWFMKSFDINGSIELAENYIGEEI